MKLDPCKCPVCGEPAYQIVEVITALAYVDVHEDGSVEYSGDTNVMWDSQVPERDEDGYVTVTCPEHEWQARMVCGVQP